MNDELRQRVIQALQRGEDLPNEWARELFPPEKREYELVYHGKEREEDIIAGTMAVPLQAERTFGKNDVDWHNMLIFGDNPKSGTSAGIFTSLENGNCIVCTIKQ